MPNMMFADLHSVVTNFGVVFSLVATLAAVVLGFFSAKQKVTVIALEESNRAYAERISTLKLEKEGLEQDRDLQRQKADVLENHITQAPDINKLAVQLGNQHRDMMTAMQQMTQELGNVAKAVIKDGKDARK